jgi:hypothetical protein
VTRDRAQFDRLLNTQPTETKAGRQPPARRLGNFRQRERTPRQKNVWPWAQAPACPNKASARRLTEASSSLHRLLAPRWEQILFKPFLTAATKEQKPKTPLRALSDKKKRFLKTKIPVCWFSFWDPFLGAGCNYPLP